MPNVAGREFPYTPQGMAAADQYRQSLGMRDGGTMGFRPLGYANGDLVEPIGNATQRGVSTVMGAPVDAANVGLGAVGLGATTPVGGAESISNAVDTVSSLVQQFTAQGIPEPVKNAVNAAVGILGMPVDVVNAALNFLGIPVSDTPIGGSRNLEETFGFPQEATPASEYTSDRSDRFGPTELPGSAGPINSLEGIGAAGGVAGSLPYGMRHGGSMGFRPINPLVAAGMGRRAAEETLQDPGLAGLINPINPLVAAGMGRRAGAGARNANMEIYLRLKGALTEMSSPAELNKFFYENMRALKSMADENPARAKQLADAMEKSGFEGFMRNLMQGADQVPQEQGSNLGRLVGPLVATGMGARAAEQEVIPQTPILPPGTGAYEMRWDPNIATTPAVEDAYYGGGIPGPSFVPTGDQTAPDFREYAGGGYVSRGMRHGGLMSLRRR